MTDVRPESGQFTALWTFEGQQWSATLAWVDGILMEWQPRELDEGRGDGEWITWHEPDTMVTSELRYIQDSETVATNFKNVTRIKAALLHLIEVQTAPSFEKPSEHDTQGLELYKQQAKEWQAALHDARSAIRG